MQPSNDECLRRLPGQAEINPGINVHLQSAIDVFCSNFQVATQLSKAIVSLAGHRGHLLLPPCFHVMSEITNKEVITVRVSCSSPPSLPATTA